MNTQQAPVAPLPKLFVTVGPTSDVKEGDIIRYPNRRRTATLSMVVHRAIDCDEGVFLFIGQGRRLDGRLMNARRVVTIRDPQRVDILRARPDAD